jgi:hypothetical protein
VELAEVQRLARVTQFGKEQSHTGATRPRFADQAALHVELARQGIPVDVILKRFRVQPTCGGRYQSPGPDNSDVCATLSFSLIVHPDEIDRTRSPSTRS